MMHGVDDDEISRKFDDALFGTLAIKRWLANLKRYFHRSLTGTFALSLPINGALIGQGLTANATAWPAFGKARRAGRRVTQRRLAARHPPRAC